MGCSLCEVCKLELVEHFTKFTHFLSLYSEISYPADQKSVWDLNSSYQESKSWNNKNNVGFGGRNCHSCTLT